MFRYTLICMSTLLTCVAFPQGSIAVEIATRPAIIHLQGPIDRGLFEYVRAKLAESQERGLTPIVIEIDSPGGLLEESFELARLLQQSKTPTIAYIPQRALSGGGIVALGCDSIVLGPQARIGDAGVIGFDETFFFRYVEEKVLSDVVRQVRDLAQSQGRSPDLAEAMMDRRAVVFTRLDTEGKREFTIRYAAQDESPQAIVPEPPETLEGEAAWEAIPESYGNRFLELNTARALELELADRQADSIQQVLAESPAADSPVVFRRTTTDAVAFWMTRPLARFFLILIGLIALYFELSAPGVSIGGLIAGLSFTLLFWSAFMAGMAGALEILLFLAGLAFLVIELTLLPGFGVAGILGLLLIIASIVMAGQTFLVPNSSLEWDESLRSAGVVLGSAIVFVVAANLISRRMGSIPFLRRLILEPPSESLPVAADGGPPLAVVAKGHPLVAIGEWGIAESVLRPAGKARFRDHSLDVVADGAFVEPDTPVQVVSLSGNRIVVTPQSLPPRG